MTPLKIEVTEAMLFAAYKAAGHGAIVTGVRDALTAAFQHPEFRRQILACVPANMSAKNRALEIRHGADWIEGWNEANDATRASLGRLLGEG